jgi:hypothetical protein
MLNILIRAGANSLPRYGSGSIKMMRLLVELIDIYRIDNLVTASDCTSVGTASIDCQIHQVADVGIFEK